MLFNISRAIMEGGRFVVPLPRRDSAKPIGESRSLVVWRFLSLERNLHLKGQFSELNVMKEILRHWPC